MDNIEKYNIYLNSLKQKYNAVCFDIDGTLTEPNSKKIDNRAIEMIANLLLKRIPVVFITGRGETGLNDLKTDIYNALKEQYKISNDYLKRMYVLTNDGIRLFYTEGDKDNSFLDRDVYITPKEELMILNTINERIINLIDYSSLRDLCNVTYSKDFKNDILLNIRIVFSSKFEEKFNFVFDKIKKDIIGDNFTNVNVTRGVYKDKQVIQIGTGTKNIAIEKAEEIIGVPKDSMIRIGDCGDIRGNDYSMLNCKQGYSVDKISDKNDCCFPVYDKQGNILKGIEATLQLINDAKILPTVCLEKANKKDYTYNYAKVERGIVLGKNKYLYMYNNIINDNFGIIDGIDGLFDKYSGSIIIPMYEWELIEDDYLKRLWSKETNNSLDYAIRDDNNFMLRGSKTYYYLLSNRKNINGKDFTTKSNVIEWYQNYLGFMYESIKAIYNTQDLSNIINKKLILGILDNYRNALLMIINHKLVFKNTDENVLVNISSNSSTDYNNDYKLLLNIESLMANICFDNNYQIDKNKIIKLLDLSCKSLYYDYLIFMSRDEIKDYSKEYRTYREIDNFAENYITVHLYNEKNNRISSDVCGMSYGGIELPILSKVLNQKIIDNVLLLKFNKKVSGYANKQLIDLRNFDINEYGGIKSVNCNPEELDLFDDNVLTGKTLQLAINAFYDCDIKVNNICIVRYPSINRIDQMFLDKHGAVDYHLFFDYINGLCFKSPYSWRDDNDKNVYEDSLGVFDKNRKKIIECLLKNHDYEETSEVGEYKRRLVK